MRLKLNLVPKKIMKNKNQIDTLTKIFNGNSRNNKFKNNLSGENLNLIRNNTENINFLNMNNSIYEINRIKNKRKKLKRENYSASLLKKSKVYKKEENNNQNSIFNIKQIHQIISFFEKKINLLNDSSKDYIYNTNYFSSTFNNQEQFQRKGFRTKKNNDNEKIEFKKNIELIPYPFKRMQNKIRKYFSLSKIKTNYNYNYFVTKLPEEKIISDFNIHKKNYLMKIRNINVNKFLENKKEKINRFRNKIYKSNNYDGRNMTITKKDKSVSTENLFLGRNNNEKRINSLFNNQLLASLTTSFDNKFFYTTDNKEKDKNKNKNENNRGIFVYHKK